MPLFTLLHTNDLHGHFDQMTRLATLLGRERALAQREGRRLLVLDAGDSSTRTVPESEVTQGRANFMMLEAMGYDAVTLGNSDTYHWGREALAKLVDSVHFPVLAGNLLASEAAEPPVPNLKSHVIFEIENLKVAVVGVTVDDPSGYHHVGYRSVYAVEFLRELLPTLRAQVNAVILLSHLGFSADAQVAQEVAGIDVIVGGHTHTQLNAVHWAQQTAIVQTGMHGNFLGRLDLELTETGVQVVHYQLLPCEATVPPDPTLSGMLELIRFEAEVVRKKTSH